MATIRIYDLKRGALALDLKDLLRLLAPQSLEAEWIVSTVKSSKAGHEFFDATGKGGDRLEELVHTGSHLSGSELAALAEDTRQVIWGQFEGSHKQSETWVTIRAVDSTFYEVETEDDVVLSKIKSAYKDVRTEEVPVTSWS